MEFIREDIPSLMLKICPSFAGAENIASTVQANFDLSGFIDHLISLYQSGKTEEFPATFKFVEDMYHNVDTGVRGVATELLEGLQERWLREGADFKPYLLPVSLQNWNRLAKTRRPRVSLPPGVAEILKTDIPKLLIASCPSFKPIYENFEDKELVYLIASEFAGHLKNLFDQNKTEEFSYIFRMIEEMHLYGCHYVQEFATIGILESLQNHGAWPEIYLLPESLKWWNSLNLFWSGKISYIGADIPIENAIANNQK